MSLFSSDRNPTVVTRIVQGLLSVLGIYAIARFLPRLVSSFFKRFVIGIIGEIFLVALGTLITQQMAGRASSHDSASSGSPERPPDLSAPSR